MKQMDILARTFRVKLDARTGTAFYLDYGKGQFLLTARHLVDKGLIDFSVLFNSRWNPIPVTLLGNCDGEIDISVLKTNVNLPKQLKPDVSKCPIETDLKLGEEVRFYGFPLGLSTFLSNNVTPVALVKRGIVSGFFGAPLTSGDESFWIDAINNPGFSGGPVVCKRGNQFAITGIVSSRQQEDVDVYGLSSRGQSEPKNVMGYTLQNAGIVLAYNIKHAIDVIENNS